MTETNVVHIPCPECGHSMVIRVNSKTGQEFMGCLKYPDCKGTAPLPAYLFMVRQGATVLPGFD